MSIKLHRPAGYTLIEVITMTAVVSFVMAVAITKLSTSKAEAQAKACFANLKTINAAKQQWALDQKKPQNVAPNKSDIYGPSLYIKVLPACPLGGAYSFRAISLKPVCTIDGHTM